MPKYHVMLDTNIYRKDPSRTGLPFQALERLCKANIAMLHLPYIVEKEFQTQQLSNYSKDIDAALSAISSILRKKLSPFQIAKIEAIQKQLEAIKPSILNDVESAFQTWVTSIGAHRHPITEQQATAAMESYFRGSSPFTTPKIRDDIPDAFIYQTILSLSTDELPLKVVVEDGKLAQASESLHGVTVYRSLSSFIESAPIQQDILHLDVIENIAAIANEFEKYEECTNNFSTYINHHGGDEIIWKKIYSRSIADDNNEATISMYGDLRNIQLYFVLLHYFGNGEFGLPFGFTTTVYADYLIYKPDLYKLDENNLPNLSDHNDHYFRAEEEFEVNVSGLMKLSIASSELNSISATSLHESLNFFGIDSIYKIEIIK